VASSFSDLFTSHTNLLQALQSVPWVSLHHWAMDPQVFYSFLTGRSLSQKR
jgi:hypothetical protein